MTIMVVVISIVVVCPVSGSYNIPDPAVSAAVATVLQTYGNCAHLSHVRMTFQICATQRTCVRPAFVQETEARNVDMKTVA
jgi:hypothetical protein